MRPRLPAILSAPGELGHRFALDCSRRNFGLRTLLAVSSVASGRIEFVSRPLSGHYSTDYPFTSSCSPPRVATTQLLSVTGGKLRHRGTLTLPCTLSLKRTSAAFTPLQRTTANRLRIVPTLYCLATLKRRERRAPLKTYSPWGEGQGEGEPTS